MAFDPDTVCVHSEGEWPSERLKVSPWGPGDGAALSGFLSGVCVRECVCVFPVQRSETDLGPGVWPVATPEIQFLCSVLPVGLYWVDQGRQGEPGTSPELFPLRCK